MKTGNTITQRTQAYVEGLMDLHEIVQYELDLQNNRDLTLQTFAYQRRYNNAHSQQQLEDAQAAYLEKQPKMDEFIAKLYTGNDQLAVRQSQQQPEIGQREILIWILALVLSLLSPFILDWILINY